MKEDKTAALKENLEKLEVLSEIYNDLGKKPFPSKKDMEIARLKMKLAKKEMLLLSYFISKQIES